MRSTGRSLILGLALLAATGTATQAQKVMTFGIGQASCATWQSDRRRREEGTAWILGFWSAANLLSQSNHLVGADGNGDTIVAAVKRVCTSKPTTTLIEATLQAYQDLKFPLQ